MQKRRLGTSPLEVSLVGLGCNNFGGRLDVAGTRAVVHTALDLGITLFDTADVYGEQGRSELALGETLGARRKDIVLATKFGMPMDSSGTKQGASRTYIVAAVEASLQRLKTDWIDLYQVHRFDPATPLEETLRALDDLVRGGKVRYIGCSNFSAKQVEESQRIALELGLTSFVSCQDEYSLLERTIERELVPAMQKHGLALLPYFPLASGLLTGKYRRGAPMPEGTRLAKAPGLAQRFMSDARMVTLEKLQAFCARHHRTLLELAFSWLAAKPCVASVIAGATRPEQLEQNAKAAGWHLSAEEIAEVDRLTA
jgi:aryl-alcohol dehydrogenase-like predicted oxidoreductase